MTDRTYVFRLRGDSSSIDATTDAAAKKIDALGAKTQEYGAKAGVAGREAAKGYEASGLAARHAANDVEEFSFKTAGAKRELLVLAHELSQGNYKQFAGSMLVLGERTGAASLLFSGLGVAALAATAILAGFTSQVVKGYLEQQQFNKDLLATGNYAGLTSASLAAYTKTLATATSSSVLASREVVTALAATGDVGPRLIGPLADAILRVQKATGQSTEEITKDFAKLSEEPAKWAAEHNKAFNFITGDQYAYIKRLDEQGEKEKAALEVSRLVSEHFSGPYADSINKVDSYTTRLAHNTAELVAEIRSLGHAFADATPEERLASIANKLAEIERTERARRNLAAFSSAPPTREAGQRGALEEEQRAINMDLLRKGEAALEQAESKRAEKARIAAINARDHWREETKGIDLVNRELEKYRKLTVEPLKGTANAISAAEQAATEAAIRKRFNPEGAKASRQLDTRFQDRNVALQQEGARLDAEIQSWTLYGRAVDKARLAVLDLEIQQGKLKGLSADRIAQLRSEAAANDAKDRALDQAKLNAEVSKSINVLRSEAQARAENARETEIARRIAELEARGVKVGTEAYIENAGEIRKWVDVKHDGILAQRLAAQAAANDATIERLDAETAALGRTTIERQKALEVLKLQKQAEQDIVANPGQRTQILDALAEKTDTLTAAMQRNYEASRTFESGVTSAFTKYQEEAANAAQFGANVIGGSLTKLEDALTTFAETGKLHLGGLFKFMADEFIRNWVRMQIAQQAAKSGSGGGLLGLLTGIAGFFGGGDVNAGTVGGSNVTAGGQARVNFATGGDVAGGRAVVVGEHGPEIALFGRQGGRVLSNSQLQAARGGKGAQGGNVYVTNVGTNAQVSEAQQDDEGHWHVLLEKAAEAGADRGYARAVRDVASGSGAMSRALKSRGVNLSARLPKTG